MTGYDGGWLLGPLDQWTDGAMAVMMAPFLASTREALRLLDWDQASASEVLVALVKFSQLGSGPCKHFLPKGAVGVDKISEPDLPDAAVEHISQMLTLAKRKHQEAMVLLGTADQNALSQLRNSLRLLEEVELLADDATSYVKADVMKAAIKDLHFQQAAVKAAIARLENIKVKSPWATPWPWFTLIILAALIGYFAS